MYLRLCSFYYTVLFHVTAVIRSFLGNSWNCFIMVSFNKFLSASAADLINAALVKRVRSESRTKQMYQKCIQVSLLLINDLRLTVSRV